MVAEGPKIHPSEFMDEMKEMNIFYSHYYENAEQKNLFSFHFTESFNA